jgi:hypothetical protein
LNVESQSDLKPSHCSGLPSSLDYRREPNLPAFVLLVAGRIYKLNFWVAAKYWISTETGNELIRIVKYFLFNYWYIGFFYRHVINVLATENVRNFTNFIEITTGTLRSTGTRYRYPVEDLVCIRNKSEYWYHKKFVLLLNFFLFIPRWVYALLGPYHRHSILQQFNYSDR